MIRGRRDPLADPEGAVRRVYAYVAYRIGPGANAEDVASEAIERALRYRRSFDPTKGEPAAWLVGIARRCVDDFFAASRPEALEGHDAADGEDLSERVVGRVDLAAALARLDERERELIALRYGADLTARQIGTLLELRQNTVEVALHRALARLRGLLDERTTEASAGPAATRPGELPGGL